MCIRDRLLIADAIKQRKTFCVSNNLDEESQVISEVEIIEHRDISNAEQLVLVKCVNLYKTIDIKTDKEYPICKAEIIIDIGLPPTTDQLDNLQIKIKESLSELIEKGLDIDIPCLLYTSPSPRDRTRSRMPSSA